MDMREQSTEEKITKLLRFCGRTLHQGMGGKCSQDRIIMILYKKGEMTQRDLTDIVGIKSGSMSEILGKIEERGLICRVKSEEDKRSVNIVLTKEGEREARAVREKRSAMEEKMYECLTEEEKICLTELLEKLADAWRGDFCCGGGRER